MNSKLTLPIYLNQKYVFDLLAIIDNGFSQVETYKSGNMSTNNDNSNIKGEIGLSNVFAFLKLGLNSELSSNNSKTNNEEILKDKIHTPNSLFSKLREHLHTEKIIKTDNFMNVETGDFIEIKLSLKKNPIIDSFEAMSSLMKIAVTFQEEPQTQHRKGQSKQISSNEKMIIQIESLLNQLKDEGRLDLVGKSASINNLSVVLTLYRAFIGDPSLSDIEDGEFLVLGKVTRILQETSDEKVNLLRKTSLSKLNRTLIDQMFSGFSNMEEHGIKNQNMEPDINPPVIQLIPIAIFT